MRNELPRATLAVALILLAGCKADAPLALGTLEWDRVTLPSPVAEKIVRVDVREGQQVAAGAPLLQLELTRTQSQLAAAQAQATQSREALAELRAGPRSEDIAQARASLAAAQAQARDADAYYARLQPLGRQQLVAASEVDRARASSQSAQAQVRQAQAALLELERGTRVEQVAQGVAAVVSAEAQASVQAVTLDKLNVVAPRAGRIDSLPYKLGDQAPVGSPLAVMLVGEAPYARVYLPQAQRNALKVGDRVQVRLNGQDTTYAGRVRMIRSEPSFTPYFALTGQDAARLSYLAEITLGKEAAELPVGAPLQVVSHGDE
ncbi:HlyD family efflux transporter periplasmic adaptor subunit [Pseudoxanthomonas sp. PXM02]|uniref:HlyD family secretion protein n=1 Tax=Pseudoxanthomonas sp. PXM02 TaxID=2769294 RepID=UPI001785ACC2|nr:HlyD family efflux transporter periplasmic adaptor subunit [Pseudoxanthomonas sp. PXM02]MBD9479641.1 HlyD family efflux transporter periplasmic adaptor subunit [Pseudoxanthomonas sp. PXM02]